MKHAVLLVLLALGPLAARAQAQLSGRVLDGSTRQPVPYASVVVPGTSLGTTANAEGEFVLRVPQLPAKVLAFSLGYGRDSATVAQPGAALVLGLAPAPIALPAAEPAGYAAELVQRAFREMQRTQGRQLYGQAFYRQLTSLDQQPSQLLEMLWQVRASSAGPEGTALSQGRFAEKKGVLISFPDFSSFSKSLHLYSPTQDSTSQARVLSPQPTAQYTLRLLGISQSNGHSLAEVEFVGKPAFNPQHVQGILTIDTDTYQLLRFRAGIDAVLKSNNPTFKMKGGRMSYDLVFSPGAGGTIPDHLTTTLTHTIGRLLKPDLRVQVVGYTYFYDWQPTTPAAVAYEPANGKLKDLDAIKQKPYDAAYWRDNPVVKRTPLEEETIKSFEQQKAFGTMLNK
ncbi:carboxypeptidase-like regulatory domain-containing protein [Hymenobacter sp. RP-2-7]|uniref:Carboxypeptidase-like regulatory domain-containing protein n=1 Tax=Hymenobacter polaris TaxID=2682546 RepID=A0A7Y0FMS1_9BACT|nr:carboxypeptidase-like regulatory domain-containing protein [Hymenobacter polaris]NML66177.1 carboxypeptidase-like regulatory domain-containing protein [Hymenobacter polaris]